MKNNIIIFLLLLIFTNSSINIYKNINKYLSLNIELNTTEKLKFENDKDIIIILDTYFEKDIHGKVVSSFFNDYLKDINEKINIIYLNYEKSNLNKITLLDQKYNKISNEININTFLKNIRNENPNKKIILSMSFMPFDEYNNLFNITNELNIKISNSYFNNIENINDYINMIKFHLYFRNNGLIVYNNEKPYFYKKIINSNFLRKDYKNHTTSILTPILSYNYFIKDKND